MPLHARLPTAHLSAARGCDGPTSSIYTDSLRRRDPRKPPTSANGFARTASPFPVPISTSRSSRRSRLTRMLDQVGSEIAALDAAPVVLLGSSLGAVVALHMAARLPERIDRLVLLAPALMFGRDGSRVSRRRTRGRLASARSARRVPLRLRRHPTAELRVLRGQPAVRCVHGRRDPTDLDSSGPPGRIGRPPHGGTVRRHAFAGAPPSAGR